MIVASSDNEDFFLKGISKNKTLLLCSFFYIPSSSRNEKTTAFHYVTIHSLHLIFAWSNLVLLHIHHSSIPFPQSSLDNRFSHEILYYSTESYAVRHERVCDWRRDETVREWSLERFHQETKEFPELWQCSSRARIKGTSFEAKPSSITPSTMKTTLICLLAVSTTAFA